MDRPKTRGPYAKSAVRRAEIVRAARDSFVEHGYERSTLRGIAERAGMSTVGMLHHFGSKEELLVAVIADRESQERERAARAADPSAGQAASLTQIFVDVLREHQEAPELMRLWGELIASSSRPDHPAHDYLVARYTATRASLAERLAAPSGGKLPAQLTPESAATLLIAVLDGLQTQWLLDPSVDILDTLTRFLDLLGRT